MKHYKLHLLCGLSILMAAIAACSKKTPQPITKVPFIYKITGLTNLTARQYIDTPIRFTINISAISGNTDSVMLLIDSVPRGVTFVTKFGSGLPAFSWIFDGNVNIDSAGIFPVDIRTSSPSGDTEQHSFNIIIAADTTCAPKIAGTYAAITTCTGIQYGKAGENIKVTGKSGDNISLDIDAVDASLYLNANCNTGLLSGSLNGNGCDDFRSVTGTFTTDKIILNYSTLDVFCQASGTCQTVLTR